MHITGKKQEIRNANRLKHFGQILEMSRGEVVLHDHSTYCFVLTVKFIDIIEKKKKISKIMGFAYDEKKANRHSKNNTHTTNRVRRRRDNSWTIIIDSNDGLLYILYLLYDGQDKLHSNIQIHFFHI